MAMRSGPLVPPPPSGLPDVVALMARGVRVDMADNPSPVHDLVGEPYGTPWGRQYRVACNRTLSANEGAMLTTRRTTCEACLRGGRAYAAQGPVGD
jgi:hypothetical protein